jgi:branched-subunit amino acid transport protein
LRFVPIALLTGLVVVGLTGQVSAEPSRLVAVAGAAFVAHRTGKMWACILGGMVVYWLIGWLLP